MLALNRQELVKVSRCPISFFACFHAVSPEHSHLGKISLIFHALVLKPLVLLIVCSARIAVDRDRQKDRHTQRDQVQYNLCCACMLRIHKTAMSQILKKTSGATHSWIYSSGYKVYILFLLYSHRTVHCVAKNDH